MEGRRLELKKLKVDQLKAVAGSELPKSTKKKDDMIEFILRTEFAGDDAGPVLAYRASEETVVLPSSSSQSSEDPKRVKVAPVFSMSVVSRKNDCRLCEGAKTLWSEVGLAVCPACSEAVCALPSPAVKQETGVTSLSFSYDADGHVILATGSADISKLGDLVIQYGFGLCESLEALNQNADVQEAAEWLVNKHRSSAENSSIAEAQLNSEQVREATKESKKRSQKEARQAVAGDISVLLEIDSGFCAKFVFPEKEAVDSGRLMAWLIGSDQNRLLVFDYLVIKRDSIKWYRAPAAKYFDAIESQDLSDLEPSQITDWFVAEVGRISDALYNIPITGGAIPALFREIHEACMHEDVEIKEVSSQRSREEIVLLE